MYTTVTSECISSINNDWQTETALRAYAKKEISQSDLESGVSYDVAIIQWITSCHYKSYDQTCNNTLTRTHNVIENVHVNNAFSY